MCWVATGRMGAKINDLGRSGDRCPRRLARIEGVIWQLKDLFGLERHGAKTLGGLLTSLAAKVAAYTCGKVLNARRGRPLRSLAELLVQAISRQRDKSEDPVKIGRSVRVSEHAEGY